MGGENKKRQHKEKYYSLEEILLLERTNQERERKTSGLETLTKTKCEAKICTLKKKRQCLKALPAKIIHNLTTQLYARENMVREFNNKHFAKLQFLSPTKKKHHFTIPFPPFFSLFWLNNVGFASAAGHINPLLRHTFKHRIPFLLVFELCPIFLAGKKNQTKNIKNNNLTK